MRHIEPIQALYDVAVHDAQRLEPKGFTVWLPRPPPTNNLYVNVRGRGRVKSARYTAWIREAAMYVNRSRPAKVSGKYRFTMIVERPDRRARDLDGLVKPVLDFLVRADLTDDDHLCQHITVCWSGATIVPEPGVIITVEPCE